MPDRPLEPDRTRMDAIVAASGRLVADFVESLPDRPAVDLDGAAALVPDLLRPPPEEGGDLDTLLEQVRVAVLKAIETAGPGYMAYIGGGGLHTSAVAEMISRGVNRFAGLASFAPGLVAIEEGVVRWLAREMGLPSGSGGLIVTGGSVATLTALVAARTERLGDDLSRGVVYVTDHTHRCVAKAARIAGLRSDQVRTVPVTDRLRMDPVAAAERISADREAGLVPFFLVGTAGSTNTGTVDPLGSLAVVAREHGLWFHVDGAYGGLFRLTRRGRERLAGIEQADSLVLDPHKTLFMPHGTGVVLVRDPSTLRRAFSDDADYLQDVPGDDSLPDYADIGPELTREHRGLRLWLPLHLHGVGAFRAALDEKLDLAARAYEELAAHPALEVPWEPDLSVVAFRLRGADPDIDDANRELLDRVNAGGRVYLSSTRIGGRFTLRLSIVSHRTHDDRLTEVLAIIGAAVDAVTAR